MAGQAGQWPGQATAMAGRGPAGSPAAIPTERRAGKGATGPGTHPELACDVGLAGGGLPAANLRRRRSGPARETAMVAATPATSARFLAQEEQGGGGGATRLVGGG
jgi:hypothetical protein